jgi:predicted deacylase
MKSKDFIKENATGGSTGASSMAVTVETLGQKGSFTQKEVNKRLNGYTNQLSPGGIVKGVKASKVK